MKIKSEKGFTGIDIAISVIILFIFVSLIAVLSYRINNASKQVELRTEATYIAIQEIENIKNNGFETYETVNKSSNQDAKGNAINETLPTNTTGFYKTISIIDYTDIEENKDKIPNLVKQATVKITYMFEGKEQSVQFSTILSKVD